MILSFNSWQDWLDPAVRNLQANSLAAAPNRLLCVDGFLVKAMAIKLATILTGNVKFEPRFASIPRMESTHPSARAQLVTEKEWEQTPVRDRFFRFDSIEALSDAATDVEDRLVLMAFWQVLAGDDFRIWIESLSRRPCNRPVLEAHSMSSGHFIAPHSDARAGRTVGVFLYLTPGWSESDGGALEIQGSNLKLLPLFNRAVLFDVDGHEKHQIRPLPHARGLRRLSLGAWFHG
ncbi:2OG-Fe(II) oxygenase [Rhizobium lentis]|uniref:Prolyl 4-hydroxylase alpha subunit Fe(2+) 2OG dioxygenase domain-containing protein n=1 Tax=Rhizobium lentis TaxID=1138194 RepID=A0A7W9CYG8_9HYPH|nr:2OG-Fe(II) oxygenase [Rhizobium lentis]MBB4577134.1 hypothetical protein [Rhizobium lentis]MBB5553961.1 hypothetical protein [Rhizobium lentis]MBB5564523.1 hypothetical protein [Rhizobium lentis]MBB5571039.1 hypothetical protein [Rhizobium lentis]